MSHDSVIMVETAEEMQKRARLAEDLRFLVLVRVRQFGIKRVARALAGDAKAIKLIRESHAARPSKLLAQLLDETS